MDLGSIGRQVSAGVIEGLSAVIYSISYGALLFSGPLAGLVGFGITVTLITAIFGALFGALSEEKTFIGGPDSNTVSVLASMLAVLGSMGLAEPLTLNLALATILLTSLVCALSFYAVARFNLASLVRYIPFSVMAGFLASMFMRGIPVLQIPTTLLAQVDAAIGRQSERMGLLHGAASGTCVNELGAAEATRAAS